MMGIPEGWVTDLDLTRPQQLRTLGNGVVPLQALEAIRRMT
jgi:DNA (cytosine-5)-methyltransferase 1